MSLRCFYLENEVQSVGLFQFLRWPYARYHNSVQLALGRYMLKLRRGEHVPGGPGVPKPPVPTQHPSE